MKKHLLILLWLTMSYSTFAQKPKKIFYSLQEGNLQEAQEEYAKIKSNKAYDTEDKILFEIADCIFLINKSNTNYNPIQSINYYNNIYKNIDNYFNTPKSKKDIVEFLAKYDLTFDKISNQINAELVQEAKQLNTVESYSKALEVCAGNYRLELLQLKEEASYNKTLQEASINSYKSFIINYNQSLHKDEIQSLLERKVLNIAKINQSLDELNSFIKEYPNSKLNQEAADIRDSIMLSKVPNEYDAMLAFTKEYANSKFINDIQLKLPDLLFEKVVQENTFESFSRFIKVYPQDFRIKEINEKISALDFIEISINKINNLDDNCDMKVSNYDKGFAEISLNGKLGIIDISGKLITPIKYDNIEEYKGNYSKVTLTNKKGYINKKGEEITQIKYDDLDEFSEGFARVTLNGKCGYIDSLGNEIIPIIYDDRTHTFSPQFNEGFAGVSLNGLCGFIDKNGKIISQLKYYSVFAFKKGLARVWLNDTQSTYIDKTGKELFPFGNNYHIEELGISILCPNKCGVLDKTGKIIVPFIYESIPYQFQNSFMVKKNGKFGIIDKQGKQITPLKYDRFDTFFEGLAHVSINGKTGLIDLNGREITPIKYDNIGHYLPKGKNEGLITVRINGKFGFINKTGREITQLKYDYISEFNDGVAKVTINGKDGAIDKEGKEIIPVGKYEYSISDFHEGIAKVYLNEKFGFIDKNGKVIIQIKYDEVTDFYCGFSKVGLNRKVGLIDKTGKEIIPIGKYYNIDNYDKDLTSVYNESGHFGYVDSKTSQEIIVIGKYDGFFGFHEGVSVVSLNDKYGVIDIKGKEIIPLKFDSISEFNNGIAIAKRGCEFFVIKLNNID